VSLLNNRYEVDQALVGRRVELVFDPFDLSDITVRYHGKQFPKAVPHVIGRHSHPKARPETEQQFPAPTGIDYLNLVAADHHDAAGAAINFHALTTPTIPLDTAIDTDAGRDPAGDPGIEHVPDHADGEVPGQQPLPGMPAPATLTIDGVAS
jgi:putative transposase